MAASTQSRRNGPVLRSISPSPCGRFPTSHNHSYYSSSSSSAFASSTSSSFYSSPSTFFHTSNHRSASPTRVNLYSSSPPSPTFRLSRSPSRSISVTKQSNNNHAISLPKKQTCLCSPTSHPGSFRCSLHKNSHTHNNHGHSSTSLSPVRLNMRRSAMTNSLVRIGGVEGELVKRALSALIHPSSHHQKRRSDFQRKPSRLSTMSKAGDDDI